jgi:hypothetical protein
MAVKMTHPNWGARTVSAEQVERYERVGWSQDSEAVPEVVEATVRDVLSQVGDDPQKARVALQAEQSRTSPRMSLVTALARIAESDTKEH